ncbi:hypothetical protein EUX98_g9327 [Antrodiella citrinella]|uniref:Uncharacterized protein n=1 Tax=Antrodiella citrinella TaxID=2447956 RepID=A0A4S4LX30_9APHY|nr:hypothetical protein EUX98_g9327 [Antrodiella citrinella]
MLLTNQRLDKLAASRSDFAARGMLVGSLLFAVIDTFEAAAAQAAVQNAAAASEAEDDAEKVEERAGKDDAEDDDEVVEGPRVMASVTLAKRPVHGYYPKQIDQLADFVKVPELPHLTARFIYQQVNEDAEETEDIPSYYYLNHRVQVFASAVATFYAPSDLSGIGGMRRERIRAAHTWRSGPPRYDCVFAEVAPDVEGFRGLSAARNQIWMQTDNVFTILSIWMLSYVARI